MTDTRLTPETGEERAGSCDIKIWSGECEHAAFQNIGDKYLCDACKTVPVLNHEVRPATMPYVSGDYKNLS